MSKATFSAQRLFLVHLSLLCLLPAANAAAEAGDAGREGASWGAVAEWHPAEVILVHRPGAELWPGVAHPWSALYEQPFDADRAALEHRNMVRSMTTACGLYPAPQVAVHELVDVLVDKASKAQLLGLAERFVSYDFKALEHLPERKECEEERAARLVERLADQEELRPVLVNAIIQNLTIHVSLDEDADRPRAASPWLDLSTAGCGPGDGYDIKAKYTTTPLMNLYFTRDQVITTAKGVVLTRPKKTVRRSETAILEVALEALGVPIVGKVEKGTLEGGDFLPAGPYVFIGLGDRTDQAAITDLMEKDVFGSRYVVAVKDPDPTQQEMHLDTYFNIAGSRHAVLTSERIRTRGACPSGRCPTVDVYERRSGRYERIRSGLDFSQFLLALGWQLIHVSKEDQGAYGTNFLTVGDRHICAVEGMSQDYLGRLRAAGITVTLIDLDHLKRGFGAAHCTTQVLRRRRQ